MQRTASLVLPSAVILLTVLFPAALLAASDAAQTVPGMYIVELVEAPLATYAGDVEGLAPTMAAATGKSKLDSRSPASRAYLEYLERRQTAHLDAIAGALARSPQMVFRYLAAANGFALKMSAAEARIVAELPGVTRVTADRLLPLDTDRGPTWIGAPSIWDGSATGGMPGTSGEGVIVGIIDTGVNMDHPSFAATGGDAFVHTNPLGSGVFVGWCDPLDPNYDPSLVCNDKLIGAWDYTDAFCAANPGTCTEADGPEDGAGHGSHTASTAAGNVLLSPAISGVAPHANLITYDACYDPSCPFSATSAAVDQAILDGVNVTNYSIGGGGSPWGGDIDTFFLGAVAAGIFPATSAGNAGPGASTLGHLGPWVATVGSSTHDRESVFNELIDMSGGGSPPADITGASRTGGYGPETIVYAGDFINGDPDPEQCLNPFPANTWTSGEIVLCDRGAIARVLKCANVAAGGAAGCVLGNVAGSGAIVADAHVIPSTHVDLADADALRTWLASGSGHTATITGATITTDPALADIMSDFSSRGPNVSFDVLKPNVTAPGDAVFAAYRSEPGLPPPEFATLGGTSMSSPHTAGSGALFSALHPTWTPAEIKSALMMSADTTVLKEDGSTPADPFDIGGGRVDLTKAAEVALVMDETHANFLAADPSLGGQPKTLNLPSLQDSNCVVECTWTRTVSSVAAGTTTWAVTSTTPGGTTLTAVPSAFSLAAGADQAIEFTANAGALPVGTWYFAEVQLTETAETGGSPDLHLPVAIRPALENLPDLLVIDAGGPTGSETLDDRRAATAITALDLEIDGLVKGNATTASLDQDPTNANAYDDLNQVFWKTFSVPAGALRLVAVTESDEAPDVDLFVGTGTTPSRVTEVCTSTTATASERCDLSNPAPGDYWLVVQNWTGSASQPDDIDVADGVVTAGDIGNFSASGPASVPAGTPFDLELAWDEPTFAGGDVWFGLLDVGTDGGSPGNLETIRIDVRVAPDYVFTDGFESGDVTRWSSSVPGSVPGAHAPAGLSESVPGAHAPG